MSRYKWAEIVSYLPFKVIRWFGRLPKIGKLYMDPADGWTFWLDADYARWCRHDKKGKIDHER